MRLTLLLITALCVLGCPQNKPKARSLPGNHVVYENIVEDTKDSIEHSIWWTHGDYKSLVCKIISQQGTIVSILPSPTSSDMVRPMANFRGIGDGWNAVWSCYLDSEGRVWKCNADNTMGFEVNDMHMERLAKVSKGRMLVHLIVSQNTKYPKFEEIFSKLADFSYCIGIGWREAGWKSRQVNKAD